jgi:cell wall-associated NlpC family hydrolase
VTVMIFEEETRPANRAAAVIAAILALIIALLLLLALSVPYGATSDPGLPGNAPLRTIDIPPQYVRWVQRAGEECPQITPPVVAAQIQAESGWDPRAVSSKGALGISQFLPGTFATWGRNDDGTGNVSPFNPADAIMAQGRYDCALAARMTTLRSQGAVSGSVLDLTLAAYNTGPGNVELAGAPPANTVSYYQQIESLAASKFSQPTAAASAPLAGGSVGSTPGGAAGSQAGQAAVATAESALGTPYQYGGSCGDPHGRSPLGWCDCSSLVQMAWAAAGVAIPRTTYEQWRVGASVASVSQLVPGDLIFIPGSDATAAGPGHVGMYIGNGLLINAPHTGTVVQVAPVSSWASQVVAMRHIR